MRPIIIAALALSPVLLHAQAIMPAQPQSSVKVPALEAKLIAANPMAEKALPEGAIAPQRISTGVIPAKLVYAGDISITSTSHWIGAGKYRSAVVDLVVDESGNPSELKLVQSAGADLDRGVLESVSHYRFKPGTLSSKAVPMPMTITVNVINPLLAVK
jgi:TonB family protein